MDNIHKVKKTTPTVEKEALAPSFRTLVQYPYKLRLS